MVQLLKWKSVIQSRSSRGWRLSRVSIAGSDSESEVKGN